MVGGETGPAALIDTHAHLDDKAFAQDLDQVLGHAWAAGLQGIVVPGLNLESSRQVVALARRHPGVYAAVGVHPHDARTLDEEGLAALERLAAGPDVVAVGEVGLDFYRNLSPSETQVWAFGELLALARRLGKPVIVHDREAHRDVLEMLGRHASAEGFQGGVLHAFSGDWAMAQQVAAWGYHLGVGGPVTYPKAHCIREVVGRVALGHLVLETDCPYLPPQPRRGQRNEPAWVTLVAEAVARVRGIPVEALGQATTENARRLFALSLAEDAALAHQPG